MTRLEQQIFFALVRAAIWTDEHGRLDPERLREVAELIPEGFDWTHLLDAFFQHAMLGLVADVILQLPPSRRPSATQQADVYSYVAQLVNWRHHVRQTLIEVFTLLEDAGLHPILLKGEALSVYYPPNSIRSVGDVDIYLDPAEFDRGITLLRTVATATDQHPDKFVECHQLLYIREVDFEVHNLPGTCAVSQNEQAYQQYSRPNLDWQTAATVVINDRSIRIFRPTYNLFYVFNHLCDHYLYGGIGFRQFVDVLLLLRSAQFDRCELEHALRDTGNFRAWQVFAGIIVHRLGYPSSLYPFYSPLKARHSLGYIQDCILEGGNFGFSNRQKAATERYISNIRCYWYMFPTVLLQKVAAKCNAWLS